MKKPLKEWFIDAPWGKIALISWGDANGEPVLLVHGRQDSAATFIPLLELMPDRYHYVGLDLPGNGRSDPFPTGVKIKRFHFVGAVEVVLKHLNWKHFVYIGHSMGCEQGLFYNAVYPHHIKKFIHLDAVPSLQRLQVHDMTEYYQKFYVDYYENYIKYNFEERVHSKRSALDAVKKARGLTEAQAEVILSRNLNPVGNDMYRLSWDKRLRTPAPQNFPTDYYYELFSKNAPPSLLITASDSNGYAKGKEQAERLVSKLQTNLKHFNIVYVKGNHDVHLTHPERLAKYICEFLERDFRTKSNL